MISCETCHKIWHHEKCCSPVIIQKECTYCGILTECKECTHTKREMPTACDTCPYMKKDGFHDHDPFSPRICSGYIHYATCTLHNKEIVSTEYVKGQAFSDELKKRPNWCSFPQPSESKKKKEKK